MSIEGKLKKGDIVYVSYRSEEHALKSKNEMIYLCTVPGNAEYKYICVDRQDEERYHNGDSFFCSKRDYVVKKEKEDKGQFNITIYGKKYKGSISDLEECV